MTEAMIVTEIGANVTVQVDTGFLPYMEYLKTLNGRPPAFGTRENGRKELSMWAKAQVPEGGDPQAALQDLTAQLQALVNQQLAIEGVMVDDPDAAVFVSTKVSTQIGGGEEW